MTPTVEQINWKFLGNLEKDRHPKYTEEPLIIIEVKMTSVVISSNTHELENQPISTGASEDTDRDIGDCQA